MDISSILLSIPYLEKLLPFGIGDALSQGGAINTSSLGVLVLIFIGYRILSGILRILFPSGTRQRTLWNLPTLLFSLFQYVAVIGALALFFSPEAPERILPGWQKSVGIWIFGVALLSAMFAILRTLRGTLTIFLWIIVVVVLGRAVAPNAFFPELISQISTLDLLAQIPSGSNSLSPSQNTPPLNPPSSALLSQPKVRTEEFPSMELQDDWETTFSKTFSQQSQDSSERPQQKSGLVYFSFAPSRPLLPRVQGSSIPPRAPKIPNFFDQLQEQLHQFSIDDLPFFEDLQQRDDNSALFFGRRHAPHFPTTVSKDSDEGPTDSEQVTTPLPFFESLKEEALQLAEKYHVREWFQGSNKE